MFGYLSLISDHLAAELVVSLCTSKGDVLDKFVSDIFDVDSKKYSLFYLNACHFIYFKCCRF